MWRAPLLPWPITPRNGSSSFSRLESRFWTPALGLRSRRKFILNFLLWGRPSEEFIFRRGPKRGCGRRWRARLWPWIWGGKTSYFRHWVPWRTDRSRSCRGPRLRTPRTEKCWRSRSLRNPPRSQKQTSCRPCPWWLRNAGKSSRQRTFIICTQTQNHSLKTRMIFPPSTFSFSPEFLFPIVSSPWFNI